jgi:hypothetical protein
MLNLFLVLHFSFCVVHGGCDCSYAGFLAVAKCGGPHVEFQPGRTDSAAFDANARLPAPTEPLFHTVSC